METSNRFNKLLLSSNAKLVSVFKVNSVIKSFRFIFLLILLNDGVIGHVSDGSSLKKESSQMISINVSKHMLVKVVKNKIPSQTNSLSSSSVSGASSIQSTMRHGDTTTTNIGSSKSLNENWRANSPLTQMQFDSPGISEILMNSSLPALPNLVENPPMIINFTQYTSTKNIIWRNGPYIDSASSPNVTALLGKTAYLICRVRNLGDKTISWMRHRDIHLLTVGRHTYTTDQRFRAVWPNIDEYTLMIKYPQHRDSGTYECQVSTTPHISHYVHLSVVEPITEIIGGPDLFIDRGSTINLTCTVKLSPEPPSYIIWNQNNAIISFNSPRGGVSVLTEKGETTTSHLLIQHAKPADSGRYSCNPSNAVPHSIVVHVLNEELPAAMHTGGQMSKGIPLSLCLVYTVVIFVTS